MRLIVLLFFELGSFKQLLRIFSTGHKDTQQQSQTAEPAKIFQTFPQALDRYFFAHKNAFQAKERFPIRRYTYSGEWIHHGNSQN